MTSETAKNWALASELGRVLLLVAAPWRGSAEDYRARRGVAGRVPAMPGEARQGRVDGREPGFDSLVTRSLGLAGCGSSGRGMVRLGAAGLGMGGWQAPGFEPPASTPLGKAWLGGDPQGPAWPGMAAQGAADQGGAWYGVVRLGSAWLGRADGRSAGSTPAPLSLPGVARSGLARQGMARRGMVGLGLVTVVDHGLAPWSSPATRQDTVGRGLDGTGRARSGEASLGWLRRGLEPVTAVGRELVSRPSTAPGQHVDRPGGERRGRARRGMARLGPATATAVSRDLASRSSAASGQFRVRSGTVRQGGARQGAAQHGMAWSATARFGKASVTAWGWGLAPQLWTAPGRYSVRRGPHWLGLVWHAWAWQGVESGGWSLARFESAPPTHAVRLGEARPGVARHGAAREGGRSSVRFDSAPPTHRGVARPGKARPGAAWSGSAWQGLNRTHGTVAVRLRDVRFHKARLGWARHSRARRGRGFTRALGPLPEFNSPAPTFMAWRGTPRPGGARQGQAWITTFTRSFTMFEVKGDQAEWRKIYAKALTLNVDDVLTYEQLDEILDRDFRGCRTPIYRVIRELEKSNARTLANVTNVGYRIAAASEHEGFARSHHQRSRRQLGKAVSKAASANRADMTPDERKRIDGLEMSLRQHAQMIRRLEQRDEQREAQIKDLRREKNADVAELSERVDRLAELLERHGVQAAEVTP